MILVIFLLLYVPNVFADVFLKPTGDDQKQLEDHLRNDTRRFYHRSAMDYNISGESKKEYELIKDGISLGCERFDLEKSLTNYVIDQIHSSEISSLSNKLINTPFLLLQYSSPTMADLLKHFDTTAHLQIAMRYRQCQDLEQMDDPIAALRKQAQMDCLRQAGYQHNIDAAFKECVGNIHKPLIKLNSPGDGRNEIGTGVNLTQEALNRVNPDRKEDLEDIKSIIPNIFITSDSVRFRSPDQSIRQVVAKNREGFLSDFKKIIEQYRKNRRVSSEDLNRLSVSGFPLTENQVKNIASLRDSTAYLAMSKISSQLAYLKTMDLYTKALEYLKRVLNHPAIETAYKKYIQANYDFINGEMEMIRQEKARLEEYFHVMGSILNEEDVQKLKVLAQIKEEFKQEESRALFHL